MPGGSNAGQHQEATNRPPLIEQHQTIEWLLTASHVTKNLPRAESPAGLPGSSFEGGLDVGYRSKHRSRRDAYRPEPDAQPAALDQERLDCRIFFPEWPKPWLDAGRSQPPQIAAADDALNVLVVDATGTSSFRGEIKLRRRRPHPFHRLLKRSEVAPLDPACAQIDARSVVVSPTRTWT